MPNKLARDVRDQDRRLDWRLGKYDGMFRVPTDILIFVARLREPQPGKQSKLREIAMSFMRRDLPRPLRSVLRFEL